MPLHPFLVHFPIAFWTFGSLMLLASLISKRLSWGKQAWFLLVAGGVFSIPAVLAGQHDLDQLASVSLESLEQHRNLGNLLPWLMMAMLVIKGHSRFSKSSFKVPEWLFALVSLGISALIVMVARLGGLMVYTEDVFGQIGK